MLEIRNEKAGAGKHGPIRSLTIPTTFFIGGDGQRKGIDQAEDYRVCSDADRIKEIVMRLTLLSILLFACTLPAFAAEPPPCNDKRVLSKLKQAYEFPGLSNPLGGKFQATEDVRETGLGPPPSGVNQYAPSKDYYNKSRYCEAHMRRDNGKTDQAYFRMDGLKDGSATDFNFDACFLSGDRFNDKCADQRPGQ